MSCSRKPCVPAALAAFFYDHPAVALAFSGGTDSAYLLYAARACGCRVRAYYLHSAFQPAFELRDARRLAAGLAADLVVLEQDILKSPEVSANPADRCYHCKRVLFSSLTAAAAADGFSVLIDGTNASDDPGDRPGMRALRELSVLSPLALCGIGKPEVRSLSREAGLFTWDKPAYACLATRIRAGEEITLQKLKQTEKAEGFLFGLGFRDFRVRMVGNTAKLELREADLPLLLENREKIVTELRKDYDSVLLNLEVRK